MISLIPNEDKKIMRKDFYFRLLVLSFVMLSISIFVATASMLPSYFISSARKNFALSKLEAQKKEPVISLDEKSLSTIKDLKSKLSLVESASQNKFVVSKEIINEVISKKLPDIKITQIYYQNDPIKGKVININGTAPSRDRLLLFRKALEGNPIFTKIDLPVSNFIKGSNIQFFLSLSSS